MGKRSKGGFGFYLLEQTSSSSDLLPSKSVIDLLHNFFSNDLAKIPLVFWLEREHAGLRI